MVSVHWGFLSVVGVRIIPHELGPLDQGLLTLTSNCVFPDSIQSIDPSCNQGHIHYSKWGTFCPSFFSKKMKNKLSYGDRRRLLDQVVGRVRLEVPSDLAVAPLFDRCHPCDDAELLEGLWFDLVKMHKQLGRGCIDCKSIELGPSLGEHKATHQHSTISTKRKAALFSMAAYLRDGLKQFITRLNSTRNESS
ncbi:F-box protein [Canna indica]|uniref:F-box protein n=1 Tax=Canna indica TaxID=4628 RepID=A0AAQ3KEN3_9LILI|nr:F-box protein [Canna indica]